MMCRNLVLAQLDAGLKDEACKSCTRAIQLASKYVPDKLVDVIRLHVSVLYTVGICTTACECTVYSRELCDMYNCRLTTTWELIPESSSRRRSSLLQLCSSSN